MWEDKSHSKCISHRGLGRVYSSVKRKWGAQQNGLYSSFTGQKMARLRMCVCTCVCACIYVCSHLCECTWAHVHLCFFLKHFYLYFLCTVVFCLHVYLCTVYVPVAPGGQGKVLGSPELKLQMVVSHAVTVRATLQDLWERSAFNHWPISPAPTCLFFSKVGIKLRKNPATELHPHVSLDNEGNW